MSEKPLPRQAGGGTKLVLIAFLLAVLSVILVNFYIERVRTQANEKTFEVYVLTLPARARERISRKHYAAIEVPARFEDSFKKLGAMDAVDLGVRVTEKEQFQRNASAGEIITYSLFLAPGSKAMDAQIEMGKRQFSLPVNSRTAPGVLHEGMYVDVEAAFNTGAALPVQKVVMERIKIIAIGSKTIYDENESEGTLRRFNTITIEVTPEQATQLETIKRMIVGDFDLHLRNPNDTELKRIPDGGINPDVLRLVEDRQRVMSVETPGSTVPGALGGRNR